MLGFDGKAVIFGFDFDSNLLMFICRSSYPAYPSASVLERETGGRQFRSRRPEGTIQNGQTDGQITKIEWVRLGDDEKVKTYNRYVD
ncbi:hypothetical protein KIN20_030587 [Parelaphostrongylus tenuis]|uniref:Uncharacterized protein n=1 Tax=Parelaphostrongylus tenuis TaxID=148309 RepID=A0AAD5R3Z6_PARTN|nr:hypothetical protein KIN20_030587 [Parelaphostrongylus tenuis]